MDDNYIKNLLEQTFGSYKIIKGLKDKPGDCHTKKRAWQNTGSYKYLLTK